MSAVKSIIFAVFAAVLCGNGAMILLDAGPAGNAAVSEGFSSQNAVESADCRTKAGRAPMIIYRIPLRPASIHDPRIVVECVETKEKIVDKPVIILEEETELVECGGLFSVAGNISNARGEPISGAELRFSSYNAESECWSGEICASSGDIGCYTAWGLKPGRTLAVVFCNGYVTRSKEFYLDENETLDFTLVKKCAVLCSVRGEDGEAVAGARLGIFRDEEMIESGFTDKEGNFEVAFSPGLYGISASANGFLSENTGYFKLNEFADAENVCIILSRGLCISGRVLDEYNQPVPDAYVMAFGGCRPECRTDECGFFTITGLTDAYYNVYTFAFGFCGDGSKNWAEGVRAGDSGIVLRLSHEGKLKIKVLAVPGLEKPVRFNIDVSSDLSGGRSDCTLTDKEQIIEMDLRPGEYSVNVSGIQTRRNLQITAVVRPEETTEAELDIELAEIPE
jgi:hypothetical protein